MISNIVIDGYKCFDHVDLQLKKFNLLAGANSVGKSSVIQSILLLLQQNETIKNPLNGKYIRVGQFTDIKNAITNPKYISIKAIEDGQESYVFEIDRDGETKGAVNYQKECIYLSAERVGVEDVYKQNLLNEYKIGIHGEYAFDYLSRERLNELPEPAFQKAGVGVNLGNQVDYWLNYIVGYTVTAERVSGTEVVKVAYRQAGNESREIRPYHIGTGVSYAANVVVSALSCRKDNLFIVENPEIHLHPSAQSRMLDFLSFLAKRGLQTIIETHSDHMFNGVRKRVKSGDILKDEVSIYFFRQNEELLSEVVRINMDDQGGIENYESGLFDQFDEDLDELLGL